MDAATLGVMHELREFMFDRVYHAPDLRRRTAEAIDMLRRLMDWHLAHPDEIPETYRDPEADRVTQAADYIAGMTDRFLEHDHDRRLGA